MKRHIIPSIAFILAISTISGCALFHQEASGTLVLSFQLHEKFTSQSLSGKTGERSLVPSSPWTPQRYVVSGTGPDGAVFSVESAQTSLKQRLVPGEWTIEVRALTSGGTVVASGTAVCVLEPSLSTQAQVTLSPLAGKGSLNLTIGLNFAVSAACAFHGTLSYIGRPGCADSPEVDPVDLAIPVTDPRISLPSLESGQYTLSLYLIDEKGKAVGGCFETILILSGFDTSGTCTIELGMPEVALAATLVPYAPLEAPILSVPCIVSDLAGFRPIARSAPREAGMAMVTRAWHIAGIESAPAAAILPDAGAALPSGLFIMGPSPAAASLNRARYDLVETCAAESRAGSTSTWAEEEAGSRQGGFGWQASFDSGIMKVPSLGGAMDMYSGAPPRYRVKAVAASASGLVVVSGLDEESAIHALAAPYGAAVDSLAGADKVPLNTSWIRLWKDKIKVGTTARTADRLALSEDGSFLAAASSASNWLRLYSLGSGGAIQGFTDITSSLAGFEGLDGVKALAFFRAGSNRLLFALCSSSRSVLVLDVSSQGLAPRAAIALDPSGESGSLSLQDLKVLDSGKVIVTASEASRIYVLGDDGTGYRIEATISRLDGSGPYHPGPLALSPSTGGFYALCDKTAILGYEPAGGSSFTLARTVALRPRSTGATTLSSARDAGGTGDLLFVAGGETVEFIDRHPHELFMDEVELESNASRTDGIASAEGSSCLRGAFILGGGISGYISVFGSE